MPDVAFLARAHLFADRIAFCTPDASHTYQELLDRSAEIAVELLQDQIDLQEARVALLVSPGFEYTASQWAIWRAGGIKLPICLSATEPEWEYVLSDSQVSTVIADTANALKIAPLCKSSVCA